MGPNSPDSSTPDLLLLELGRRVLCRDVGRVVDLAEGLMSGTRHLDQRRRPEFADLAAELCDDIAGELGFEDSLLWPLLEQHAPGVLPYESLRTDREELRALAAEARRTTRAVITHLASRPAALATVEDHRRVRQLALVWRGLGDRLDAFVVATAADVADLVTTRVPPGEWARTLDVVRASLPDPRSAGARVVELATPDELERLRGQLGPRPLAGWSRHGRRRRARAAVVFGLR